MALGCAPPRAPGPFTLPPSYRAVGSFHYETPRESFRGMWDLLCRDQEHYRLAIYSNLGTLEGCLAFDGKAFTSCGGNPSAPNQVLGFLPAYILARLPQILLGHPPMGEIVRDPQGRTTQAKIILGDRVWNITYSHYLAAEGIPYPTLVVIRGDQTTLKIRTEEMKPGWTPSSG